MYVGLHISKEDETELNLIVAMKVCLSDTLKMDCSKDQSWLTIPSLYHWIHLDRNMKATLRLFPDNNMVSFVAGPLLHK